MASIRWKLRSTHPRIDMPHALLLLTSMVLIETHVLRSGKAMAGGIDESLTRWNRCKRSGRHAGLAATVTTASLIRQSNNGIILKEAYVWGSKLRPRRDGSTRSLSRCQWNPTSPLRTAAINSRAHAAFPRSPTRHVPPSYLTSLRRSTTSFISALIFYFGRSPKGSFDGWYKYISKTSRVVKMMGGARYNVKKAERCQVNVSQRI